MTRAGFSALDALRSSGAALRQKERRLEVQVDDRVPLALGIRVERLAPVAPALLTSTFRCGTWAVTRDARSVTPSTLERSHGRLVQVPSSRARPQPRHSPGVARAISTFAPASTKPRAMPRPMPREPPVTRTLAPRCRRMALMNPRSSVAEHPARLNGRLHRHFSCARSRSAASSNNRSSSRSRRIRQPEGVRTLSAW